MRLEVSVIKRLFENNSGGCLKIYSCICQSMHVRVCARVALFVRFGVFYKRDFPF